MFHQLEIMFQTQQSMEYQSKSDENVLRLNQNGNKMCSGPRMLAWFNFLWSHTLNPVDWV